jgi:branched-chain amino acid transport system substrate-binding protein
VLHDGEGTGFAGAVYAERAARRLGLRIAGVAAWNPAARSYRALALRIKGSGADAVVLSGCICSNGGRLVHDLRAALGRSTTLIGTDNFTATGAFVHPGGAFDGLYISTAGVPPQALPPRGRRFLSRVAPGRSLRDFDPSAAYAAQAAATLLDAIARSDGTRASVDRQLLATRISNGLIGPLAFDSHGDPAPAPIAIYRVDSHARLAHQFVPGLVFDRIVRTAARPRSGRLG